MYILKENNYDKMTYFSTKGINEYGIITKSDLFYKKGFITM